MTRLEMKEYVTAKNGKRYRAVIIPEGSRQAKTTSPCELCDLRGECTERECWRYREETVLSLTCMKRTYFKEIR